MAKKKRVVLNLAEMRASNLDAPVIVDQDGKEHTVGKLSVDAYLTVLDLEQQFTELQEREEAEGVDRSAQKNLMRQMKELIGVLLPGFPTGGLYLDELFAVITAAQGATGGEVDAVDVEGAASDEKPGE